MKKTTQKFRNIAISGFISKIWIPRNLFTHVDFAERGKEKLGQARSFLVARHPPAGGEMPQCNTLVR